MPYSLFTYITPFNIFNFDFNCYYLDVLRLDCTFRIGQRWGVCCVESVRLRVIPYNDISLFGDNLGALYVW